MAVLLFPGCGRGALKASGSVGPGACERVDVEAPGERPSKRLRG